MKKIKKRGIAILILSIVILLLIGISHVNAGTNDSKIIKHRFDGIYAVYRIDGEIHYGYAQRFTLNGITAYCIEMGVKIYTETYSSTTDLSVAGLSNDVMRYLRLVAYYGYDYEGHATMNYTLAAQELMWEKITGKEVYWVTSLNAYGERVNVDYEKNEITNLINNHTKLPSFDESVVELNVGESITLTDSNGVLSQYEVYNSDLDVTISDNTMIIKADNTTSEKEIQLIKKNYLSRATLIYHSGSNQKLISAGALDPVISTIKVISTGGDVTINKLDKDTKTNETQGVEATLEGAVYGVYDLDDNLVTTITTDESGYAKSESGLAFGDYYLEEITASKGYELDKTKYHFSITNDNLYPEINVYEQIINRDVELTKYYASSETGVLIPEVGIEFAIYDSKENNVTSIIIDENGYATTNLVYGTYLVKQVNTTSGYEKVDDFKIIVNSESASTIRYALTNAQISAKLKLIKIDSESSLTIPYAGVTFKIKNVDTDEYVCQHITYPVKETICEFETDENGIFITPTPLVSGTYQIEEVTSPTGYLLKNEYYTFRIDENSTIIDDNEYGQYIEVLFENDKVMGEIVINKFGEFLKVEDGAFNYENNSLIGVEFALYADEEIKTLDGVVHYNAGDLVSSSITNENGQAIFTNLHLGKYKIVETRTLDNYILDETEYSIELSEIDNKTAIVTKTLDINNKLKKSDLVFTKTDLVDGEVIPNTVIEIYTENDECIFRGITDENGQITINDLSIGKYYIIEKEPATGYVITNEIVYFEILENGEIVKAEMTNKPIVGSLEFTKVDISTSEPLPNTLIQIFNDKDELIFEDRTDENGMIIIEELEYGKYYILEKEAPDGYVLNEEKMYFEILEDEEIVKATMVNEKVVIEVPITGVKDYHVIEILSGMLLLSGIGVIVYVKKKKRK